MSDHPMTDTTPFLRPTQLQPARPTSHAAAWAQARLGELGAAFDDLIRQAPGVRQVIGEQIALHLALDAQATGLTPARGDTPAFVSLAHVCVFARHHPASIPDLSDKVSLRHLDGSLPGTDLPLASLLATLQSIDLYDALTNAWNRYWHGCQPGTPSNRKDHARALYQEHVLVSLQAVQDQLSDDASLGPLIEAILTDPHTASARRPGLIIESAAACPGALVFSLEGQEAKLSYRPDRYPSIMSHTHDSTLWQVLSGQSATPLPLQRLDAIAHGFTLWQGLLFERLAATLAQDPGDDLWQHGPLALQAADRLAQAWHGAVFLVRPSEAHEGPLEDDTRPSLFDLGGLQLDVPTSERAAQISRQLEQVSRVAEHHPERLTQCQTALTAAQEAALPGIDALLRQPHWHSDAAPIEFSAALIEAHRQGLLAHARFQRLLGELDDQDLARLETVATATDPQSLACLQVSHPLLLQAAQPEDHVQAQSYVLKEAVVIASTLADDGTPAGHLWLYWIGEQGGLLRCADRAQLEHCLRVHPEHGQSLAYVPVSEPLFDALLQGVIVQARAQRQRIQDEHGLDAVAQALPELREVVSRQLRVPRHAARDLALDMLEAQQRALRVADQAPDWLKTLPIATRSALQAVVEAYVEASRRAHALVVRDLPVRDVHCRALVAQRLRQDFPHYDDSPVTIDLPTGVSWQDDPIAGSGAPGVPVKQKLVPSAQREQVALDVLLLNHVDEGTLLRLKFSTLVIDTPDLALKQALERGLTPAYLQSLAKDLDLAQAYENLILHTYRGVEEDTCAARWRRACLTRPLQLMLKLQALLLQSRGLLDAAGHAILDVALNAQSQTDYQAGGHDVRLLAATLTAGGPDTDDRPATLSGVTFIEDQASGITLLCLPEHPDLPLSQYPDLESARWALYRTSLRDSDRTYLASRALEGDPSAHRSRLQQAQVHGFDGIIGIGATWPANLSLPALLLEAQLGKILTAHRTSSRSNRDLWLEHFTHQSGMIFNYLKMALSVLPFVGTAIGIHDVVTAGARAAAAFVEGETGRALVEVNDVLLALIDVAMDLVTGVAVNTSLVRQATRQRQIRQLQTGLASLRRPRPTLGARLSSLDGYVYERPLSLQGTRLGTEGRYKGVYRHAEGDFILIDGRPLEVIWDATAHTWRLKGKPGHVWQRAVALDEQGRWDTHFALYGVHLYGGGAGGGQALGRLADQLEPHWPAAIRERLPRFLVDRHYRRQRMLQTQCQTDERRLQRSLAHTNQLFTAYENTPLLERLAQIPSLLEASETDIRLAEQLYRSWDDYLNISAGRNRRVPLEQKADTARVICDRLLNQVDLHNLLSQQTLWESAQLHLYIDELKGLFARAPLLREARKHAIAQLGHRERMFRTMERFEAWYPKATPSQVLNESATRYRAALNGEFKAWYQTYHLMLASKRFTDATVVAEFLLEGVGEVESEVLAARSTLFDLHDASLSVAQRRTIHQQTRETLERCKRQLHSAYASMPSLFEEDYLKQLQANLDTLLGMVERKLRRLPNFSKGHGEAARSPRLFLDTNDRAYIGDFLPGANGQPEQMVIRADDGSILRRFIRAQGDRWLPAAPAVRARELREVSTIASDMLAGLEAYRGRIQRYQRQGMLAVDLEHMMRIKAEDLERCAHDLRRLDPAAADLPRLVDQARALREEGRILRVAQSKRTRTPDTGHLTYLLEQQEVSIRRVGDRQALGTHDYLQEYAIVDEAAEGQPALWYAHFHYRRAETPFTAFTAAHLKRAADRYVGRDHPEVWRGTISPQTANELFAHL